MKYREFSFEDQIGFAQISGDYNPLHVDAIAARRLLFGSSVVHGVHSLLWSLDCWLENIVEPVTDIGLHLHSLKASFLKPIRVGENVSFSLKNISDSNIIIELLSGDLTVTRIEVSWEKSQCTDVGDFKPVFPPKVRPQVLREDKIAKKTGVLDLYLNAAEVAKRFPSVARCICPMQLAVILATTRLVGIECPGLNSLYFELSLCMDPSCKVTGLNYEVVKFDKRFGLVLMKIAASGMTGDIKAFVRPLPQEQESYLNIKKLVGHNEFSGQRELIIGGSRGLGELCAKLLAAGGASVRITYHKGAQDACHVVNEIVKAGGSVDSFSLDVLDKQKNIMDSLGGGWNPTHLYYFASPFIVVGIKNMFSASLFQRFCDYYVVGFQRVVEQLKAGGLEGVFYPSSIFVDELSPGMGEYVTAKMAGETLCTFMEKTHDDIVFYKPRLQKMATDQTASIMPVKVVKPTAIMLKQLRLFKDASALKGSGLAKLNLHK